MAEVLKNRFLSNSIAKIVLIMEKQTEIYEKKRVKDRRKREKMQEINLICLKYLKYFSLATKKRKMQEKSNLNNYQKIKACRVS